MLTEGINENDYYNDDDYYYDYYFNEEAFQMSLFRNFSMVKASQLGPVPLG